MMGISGPIARRTASFMAMKCGHGKPMGVPLVMQEVKAIAPAPR